MPGNDSSIKAGQQRHLVHILIPTAGPVGAGGSTKVFTPIAMFVPAEISPASATDSIRSGQTVSQTQIPVTIRWIPQVVNESQLQFVQSQPGSSVYTVTSVYVVKGIINVDQRNRKMTLACLGLAGNT
jgi:head-tail adaptor